MSTPKDTQNDGSHSPSEALFKQIPGVDILIETISRDDRFDPFPLSVIKSTIRRILNDLRSDIKSGGHPDLSQEGVVDSILIAVQKRTALRLVPTINATGVVLHTNLGRAPLSSGALERIDTIARGFSNLEFEIEKGKRGERYSAVEPLLCELTGAEAALAVNNNAGAVLLALNTLAKGHDVIVSRGELVEIGGSFRIPDVMEKSGCSLKEVGTTNRTHLKDYRQAITENTALLLKVHTSNYTIQGFTASVDLADLVTLGRQNDLLVMEDLGSGSLIDLSKYGLGKEPTAQDAVARGADIVTFSGDKLLGGPQAGIIVGRRDAIQSIKANPLTRALRIDKLTLAALETTLALYRDEATALKEIPTLRMLTTPFEETVSKTERMIQALTSQNLPADISWRDLSSRTGGGSYPELPIASRCMTVHPHGISVAQLEKRLRLSTPAVICRIDDDRLIVDPRTLQNGDEALVIQAITDILEKATPSDRHHT